MQVRRAIDDLLALVHSYPRENADEALDEKEVQLFVRHFSKNMYNAITTCTLNSLQAMKRRLGSKTSTDIYFMERPFFDVDVELKVQRPVGLGGWGWGFKTWMASPFLLPIRRFISILVVKEPWRWNGLGRGLGRCTAEQCRCSSNHPTLEHHRDGGATASLV